MPLPLQRTFEDMGAHLSTVPFCILDIETTGGVAADLGITEIGAIRFVGGEVERTFHTLVDPGLPIPPAITMLTGITHRLLRGAPRVAAVIPTFLEFVGDAVIVGHNVRYDMGYLHAAAAAHGYGRIPNRTLDTLRLARRLLPAEVRDFRLGTLAAHFRAPAPPIHRALEDATATAHVFWGLLERAGALGITHLDDLLAFPASRGRPDFRKISLADGLPRHPGVYLFRDRRGEVFYIGKAKDLRSRVRSYFYGDERKSVEQMLRELAAIDHRVCATELEAEVTELRLISAHRPRHNRRSKPPRSSHFVRLTRERFPRLALARSIAPEAHFHLGPFRSLTTARTVMEALWDATPVRRCTHPPGSRSAPCSFAQLGDALCPCDGTLDESAYAPVVERLVSGVATNPDLLLRPLETRIASLARERRFEEAGWVRDRHRALASALQRRRAWGAMQHAGLMRLEGTDGGALVDRGRLVAAWPGGAQPPLLPADPGGTVEEVARTTVDAEEAHLVWRWLEAGTVQLIESSAPLWLPTRPVKVLTRIAV